MALFPVSSLFEDDFVVQLVPVDTEDNMDDVAQKCAYHSVNRRVFPVEGKVMRVKRHSNGEVFPRNMRVQEANLLPTETIEVFYSDN
jgi:toluene monooxygenase system protein B